MIEPAENTHCHVLNMQSEQEAKTGAGCRAAPLGFSKHEEQKLWLIPLVA